MEAHSNSGTRGLFRTWRSGKRHGTFADSGSKVEPTFPSAFNADGRTFTRLFLARR